MFLSNKDENKGNMLATYKTEITGKQDMKGEQRM